MSVNRSDDAFEQGRGAQINPSSRYDRYSREYLSDVDDITDAGEKQKTQYIDVYPKTILSENSSPDVGFNWSINPYQGCEHGCTYCYARRTHPYWSLSAGRDFEQKILIKTNAPELLENKLKSSSWKAEHIMLSGNTDCYQPVEQERGITRKLLEVFWKYRHPVSLITKNSLILRDLDLLQKLARHDLTRVAVSLTSLNESLRRKMEPRTASGRQRLKIIRTLADHDVPVIAMLAPIIPSLNEPEIPTLVRKASEAGAWDIYHLVIRLNGEVQEVFEDWIGRSMPDRAERVLNQIAQCHGGRCGDSRFGIRMKGEGPRAEIIAQQVHTARRRWLDRKELPELNTDLHSRYKSAQLQLFDS